MFTDFALIHLVIWKNYPASTAKTLNEYHALILTTNFMIAKIFPVNWEFVTFRQPRNRLNVNHDFGEDLEKG